MNITPILQRGQEQETEQPQTKQRMTKVNNKDNRREQIRKAMTVYRARIDERFKALLANATKNYRGLIKKIQNMYHGGRKYCILPQILRVEGHLPLTKQVGHTKATHGLPINFSLAHLKDRYEYKFYDSEIEDPLTARMPDYLMKYINTIKDCLLNIRYTRASIITSFEKCNEQKLHADEATYYDLKKKNIEDAPYSLIMALEDEKNPTSIIIESGKGKTETRILKPGEAILMRGDLRHAGAAYKKINNRLFIAFGTENFPNRGETTGGLTIEAPNHKRKSRR